MKKSFLLYIDKLEILDDLTDEEAGSLFKAIRAYVIGEPIGNLDRTVLIAFKGIKTALDEDSAKYERISEMRREAGKLGGAPKGNKNASKQPKQAKQAKQPDTDTVTVTVTDTDYIYDIDKGEVVFQPPSLIDIKEYCREQGYIYTDPERFFLYYEKNGWVTKDGPMKDWRSVLLAWETKDRNRPPTERRKNKNRFTDFPQRGYNVDELEKALLEKGVDNIEAHDIPEG